MKRVSCIFFLLFTWYVDALPMVQDNTADVASNSPTVENNIPVIVQKEQSRFVEVSLQADQLRATDYRKAIAFLQVEIEKAKSDYQLHPNYTSQLYLAKLYSEVGDYYIEVSDYENQLKYAQLGIKLLGSTLSETLSALYSHTGFAYEMTGEYNRAQHNYQKGLEVAKAVGSKRLIAKSQLNIAAVYSAKEEYEQALTEMKSAYELVQSIDEPALTAETLSELGLLYNYLNETSQALLFHKKALLLSQQHELKSIELSSFYNIATSYIDLNQYSNAVIYLELMIKESKKLPDLSNFFYAYSGLSQVNYQLGNYDKAYKLLLRAETYLDSVQEMYFVATHYLDKASILARLGNNAEAIENIVLAEKITPTEEINNTKALPLMILERKAELFSEVGDSERAYKHLKDYVEAYKRARNHESNIAIDELRIAFDMERKDAQAVQLSQNHQENLIALEKIQKQLYAQRLTMVLLVILASLLVFFVILLKRNKAKMAYLDVTSQNDVRLNQVNILKAGRILVKKARISHQPLGILVFEINSQNERNGVHLSYKEQLDYAYSISTSCLRDQDVYGCLDNKTFVALFPGIAQNKLTVLKARLISAFTENDISAVFEISELCGDSTTFDDMYERTYARLQNIKNINKK